VRERAAGRNWHHWLDDPELFPEHNETTGSNEVDNSADQALKRY